MAKYTTVRHLKGTTWKDCAHGTWKAHYKAETNSKRTVCSALGCSNPFEVGAHVMDLTRERGKCMDHFIVPLCKTCNHRSVKEDIDLKAEVKLARANTQIVGCYLEWPRKRR